MYKIGDEVYRLGSTEVGTITEIVDKIAVVKFIGRKEKIALDQLIRRNSTKHITIEEFDTAVVELMTELAQVETENDTKIGEGVAAVVGPVCAWFRSRLFENGA